MFVVRRWWRTLRERVWLRRTVVWRVVLVVTLVTGLLLPGVLLVRSAILPEPPAPLGADPYATGQRQLRATEAMAHLAVLENDLAAGRPSSELRAQHARIRHDLEWALAGAGDDDTATELRMQLDRLDQQLQEESPRAADTVADMRARLRQAHAAEASGTAGVAGLRVVNLSASAPPIRVWMGNEELFGSLEQGVVTGYRAVRSGDMVVTVWEQGSEDGGDSAEASERPTGAVLAGPNAISPNADAYYTLVLTSSGAGEDQAANARQGDELQDQISMRLLEDEVGNLPAAGRVSVRVVNVTTGLEALDVTTWEVADETFGAPRGEDSEEAPPLDERTTLGEAIAFGEAGPYVDMDSGRHVVEFRRSGAGDVLLDPVEMDLVEGATYSVYLFGRVESGASAVIVSVDTLVRDASSGTSASPPGAP